jgi:hypothetical protein
MPDSKGIEVELIVLDGGLDAGQKPPASRA